MRIDTHAHAFPGVAHLVRKLPRPVRMVAGGAASLTGRALARLPRCAKPLLGVERLARFRSRGPRRVHQAAEVAAGLAMLPQVAVRSSLADLIESMNRNLVTRTVVIAAWPTAPNDWLLEAAAQHAGRVIPVAHPPVLPEGSPDDAWQAAYHDLADRGAAGFKIHPNMDGMPVDAPAYHALFEVARERDRFVIVHTGCFNVIGYKTQRPAAPDLFEPWFAKYPEVRVCLAHMNRDHPDEAWEVMRRHDQVWADTSWQTAESIRRAIDAVGAERIVLGSDWPLLHADLQGDSISQLEHACTDAEIEQILGPSAQELLPEV
jgi:predicted TIM-barrel fold metal-dependent hydrolase